MDELVRQIANTEGTLAISGETVGGFHETLNIERKSPWKKKLLRQFERDGRRAKISVRHDDDATRADHPNNRPTLRSTTSMDNPRLRSPSVSLQPQVTRMSSLSTCRASDGRRRDDRCEDDAYMFGEKDFKTRWGFSGPEIHRGSHF